MAFVNERIMEADVEKYGLKEIDSSAPAITIKRRDLTIDRERNVYLRQTSQGHIDTGDTHISWWTLYWKGELLWLQREAVVGGGKCGGSVWGRIRIKNLQIPPRLEHSRQSIYQDLREAFLAYRDGGVGDSSSEFSLQIDIEA
jgi:hypothetical protein